MRARANPRSLGLIVAFWAVLQLGGLFTPGLLDDVDSVYIEVAREMLHRHDFVTPMIDGVRFLDKPPLMYWLAAGSMRVLGEHDWSARLPLSLTVLGLFFAIYGLGLRLFAGMSAGREDRGALYGALVFATALGPYLYTRFFIPDLLICLWMTLGVHCFLVALDRVASGRSALWPCLGFGAVLGLNLLTKGFIGLAFPLGFVALYGLITRQMRLLLRMPLLAGGAVFLAVALPWHVLAALRNPAIAMPAGMELPARAGWAWFYLFNEHVARALGTRVPHDYGQTPRWLFWTYAVIWMMPWAGFLPAAGMRAWRHLGHRAGFPLASTVREREAALVTVLWAGIVLVFFTLASRQEYYQLPALPALALALGGTLAAAEGSPQVERWVLLCHRAVLLPIACLIGVTCIFFAVEAPRAAPGVDLSALLSQNPELYNLSLGHLFDLTGAAMGLFRGPLTTVAGGMVLLGVVSFIERRRGEMPRANLMLAAGMTLVLLAAHEGLVRFNPILGSKGLADAIVAEQAARPLAGDRIALDGELTSGSTLLFYTRQPVELVNGRVNGPWFGSFWPDAPRIFWDENALRREWAGPERVFLMTYDPGRRVRELSGLGKVGILASAGGKTVLVNR